MELDPAAVLPDGDGEHERWEAISDLDNFFTRVYTYYQERGLRCIVAGRVVSLLLLGWTIGLAYFLLEFLNIYGLVHECQPDGDHGADEQCKNVPLVAVYNSRPFAVAYFARPTLLLFSLFWLWSLGALLLSLRPLLEMSAFFSSKVRMHACMRLGRRQARELTSGAHLDLGGCSSS